MTPESNEVKQVTAADVDGFVKTVSALLKHDELNKGTKDQFDDALRAIGNDFGAANITEPDSIRNWLSGALVASPDAARQEPDDQTDEADPYLESVPVDPITLGTFFPDDDAEGIVRLIVDGTEEHAVDTLAEFALHFYNMLGSKEPEHIRQAQRDMGMLLEALFSRTKTHSLAFRLYRMQPHILMGKSPASILEKAIAENVGKGWGGEAE